MQPLPPIEARQDLGMLGYEASARMVVASVMTGTTTSIWSFHNPNGLTTIRDYHSATFDQRVLSQEDAVAAGHHPLPEATPGIGVGAVERAGLPADGKIEIEQERDEERE